MQEQEHVLEVLEKTKEAIEQEDALSLKNLSNQTIHSASINQDSESIMLAVIIYSISKIVERTNYREYKDYQKFLNSIKEHIEEAIISLKEKKISRFIKELEDLRDEIDKLEGHFKEHIRDVFNKASINKASRIYEHGVSMERTSKLLGITIFDLADYAGHTGIADVNLTVTMPLKKRIKIAEEIFYD